MERPRPAADRIARKRPRRHARAGRIDPVGRPAPPCPGSAAASARRRRALLLGRDVRHHRAEGVGPDRGAVGGQPGEQLAVGLAGDGDPLAADAVELEDGEPARVDGLLREGDELARRSRSSAAQLGTSMGSSARTSAAIRSSPARAARKSGRSGVDVRLAAGRRVAAVVGERPDRLAVDGEERRVHRRDLVADALDGVALERVLRLHPLALRAASRACAGRGGRSRGWRARGRARRGRATRAAASRATPSGRARRTCRGGRPPRDRAPRGRGGCPCRRRRSGRRRPGRRSARETHGGGRRRCAEATQPRSPRRAAASPRMTSGDVHRSLPGPRARAGRTPSRRPPRGTRSPSGSRGSSRRRRRCR